MNTVKVFKDSVLFKGLEERIINILANISETANIPSETVIFSEGMPSDTMFVIASGRVEVLKDTAQGNESVIGELETGDVLGILSLIAGGKRTVTVKAKEQVVLVTITRDNFDKLVSNNIHAAYQIIVSITKYFADLFKDSKVLKEIM